MVGQSAGAPLGGDLDLNALKVFVAVVEQDGFRGAARALGMPRSTVSRKVMDLEAQLGVQVLRRTTRSLKLTEAGEALHRQAVDSLGALGAAVREVRDAQAAPSGVLKVTAPLNFAEAFLAPVLDGFLRAQPEVRVVLHLTDRWVDLVAEGYDVALRAGELPDSSLKARRLGASPFHCYASPAYLAGRPRPRTPDELAGHVLLTFSTEGRAQPWPFVVRGRRVTVPVKSQLVVNSFVLLRALALAGHGIARLPAGLVTEAEEGGTLTRLLEAHALPPSPMHAVYPAAPHPAPRLRVFLDYLEAHFPGWEGST